MKHKRPELNETVLEVFSRHKEVISWNYISRDYELTYSEIVRFSEYLNFSLLSRHQNLDERTMREFKDKLDWNYISQFQKLDVEFIEEMSEYINFSFLIASKQNIIHERTIIKYIDRISLNILFSNNELSMDCIRAIENTIFRGSYNDIPHIEALCRYQKLDSEFIRNNKGRLSWILMSRFQEFTLEDIIEFKDWVYWDHIVKYQEDVYNDNKEELDKLKNNKSNNRFNFED